AHRGTWAGCAEPRRRTRRRAIPTQRHVHRSGSDPSDAGSHLRGRVADSKTPSEVGARIVGRLQRMHATVPAILHHLERWDGNGYPHRLAGNEIPLEASIVGLADAVDAMTMDPPYSSAPTLDEATGVVILNSCTQFAPAVVDAFVALVERVPALFGIDPAASELVSV